MIHDRSLRKYLLVIGLLTVLIYLVGVNGVFVYDDGDQILNRPRLHDLFRFHDVLFCGLRQHRVWQNISFAMNWTISDGKVWSFKLFSLGLHLVNSWILFKWLKRIFEDRPMLPVLTTAFFLIHPLQTQSVTYVMGVISLIQGFFYLISLYWITEYRLTRMAGLVVILAASLLAKETCMLIPILLFGYDFTLLRKAGEKIEWKKWAIVFAVPFLFFPIYEYLKDPVSMFVGTSGFNLYPFFLYLASQLYYQIFYFILFFNPTLMSVIHEAPVMGDLEVFYAALGGLIWLLTGLFAIFRFKKYPRTAFFIFFYYLNYLPTNSVFQMINPFAEYRLYLPNITIFLGFSLSLLMISDWLQRKKFFQSPHWTIPSLVIVYFGIFTFLTVYVWRDDTRIYSRAAELYPNSELIHINLGVTLVEKNKYNDAFDHLFKSRMNSGWWYSQVQINALVVARKMYEAGDYRSAWKVMEALEHDPSKDPLPKKFPVLKSALKQKMIEHKLPLETDFKELYKSGQIYSSPVRPKESVDE
jgi:hypothetical protein